MSVIYSCCRLKLKKKAQMEIMGLAIIVILLALIMFFVIKFVVLKEPSETKKTFQYSEYASNIVSALLETDVTCLGQKVSMSELFRNCAQFETYDCIDDISEPLFAGPDSCEKLNRTIATILGGTLDSWNTNYRFESYVVGDSGVTISNFTGNFQGANPQGCDGMSSQAELYPLPLNPGTVLILLNVC